MLYSIYRPKMEPFGKFAVEGGLELKALDDMDWLVHLFKTERYHQNIDKVAALIYVMPAHHLKYGNMCLEYNKLKMHPQGC